jgi:hypothetical protein
VEIAVVPPDDARAVFLAKIDLPLLDHGRSSGRTVPPDRPPLRPALPAVYCWSMIFSENRYPLFGIML